MKSLTKTTLTASLFALGALSAVGPASADVYVESDYGPSRVPGYIFVRADLDNDGYLDAYEWRRAERLNYYDNIKNN